MVRRGADFCSINLGNRCCMAFDEQGTELEDLAASVVESGLQPPLPSFNSKYLGISDVSRISANFRGSRLGLPLVVFFSTLVFAVAGIAAIGNLGVDTAMSPSVRKQVKLAWKEKRMDMQLQLRNEPEKLARWIGIFGDVSDEFSRRSLEPKQVAWLLAMEGFPEEAVSTMVCVASKESEYRPSASNRNTDGSYDTGLFQINDLWKNECQVTRKSLLNPVVNTRCALKVWRTHGYSGWTAYRKHSRKCRNFEVAPTSNLASR